MALVRNSFPVRSALFLVAFDLLPGALGHCVVKCFRERLRDMDFLQNSQTVAYAALRHLPQVDNGWA